MKIFLFHAEGMADCGVLNGRLSVIWQLCGKDMCAAVDSVFTWQRENDILKKTEALFVRSKKGSLTYVPYFGTESPTAELFLGY